MVLIENLTVSQARNAIQIRWGLPIEDVIPSTILADPENLPQPELQCIAHIAKLHQGVKGRERVMEALGTVVEERRRRKGDDGGWELSMDDLHEVRKTLPIPIATDGDYGDNDDEDVQSENGEEIQGGKSETDRRTNEGSQSPLSESTNEKGMQRLANDAADWSGARSKRPSSENDEDDSRADGAEKSAAKKRRTGEGPTTTSQGTPAPNVAKKVTPVDPMRQSQGIFAKGFRENWNLRFGHEIFTPAMRPNGECSDWPHPLLMELHALSLKTRDHCLLMMDTLSKAYEKRIGTKKKSDTVLGYKPDKAMKAMKAIVADVKSAKKYFAGLSEEDKEAKKDEHRQDDPRTRHFRPPSHQSTQGPTETSTASAGTKLPILDRKTKEPRTSTTERKRLDASQSFVQPLNLTQADHQLNVALNTMQQAEVDMEIAEDRRGITCLQQYGATGDLEVRKARLAVSEAKRDVAEAWITISQLRESIHGLQKKCMDR
jgi:hypothetical protein